MRQPKPRTLILAVLMSFTISAQAQNTTDLTTAIDNGLRYLESVQFEHGEFPTTFTPNLAEPQKSLQSTLDSNLFTTTMLADALQSIKSPRVDRIEKKATQFIASQLNNQQGLWSYFTTHNPNPIYPLTIYDLDDTAFASMVLRQNHVIFPDNRAFIKANKDATGAYNTWVLPEQQGNVVDCGVNANVLSYLQENDPQACQYLNEQVATGKQCAMYYSMSDAYYLIARAYASGVSCLKPSVDPMIHYVLSQFDKNTGSVEQSPFKTAIALNTLQSLNYKGPEIYLAEKYLLETQSPYTGSWPGDEFWYWAGIDDNGSPYVLGRSSSSALTTAIALKALNALNAIQAK